MLDKPQLADRTNSAPIAAAGPIVIRSQREFLDAIRGRIEYLNVSRETVNELCSMGQRYANKLLCPSPMKRLAIGSLFRLARGLGCDLLLAENPSATAQIRGEIVPRKLKLKKSTAFAVHRDLTYRFMRKIGRKGGASSRSNMTRRQASALARKAALARWKKAKATKPTYVGTSRKP
jgi:hypothetical protein